MDNVTWQIKYLLQRTPPAYPFTHQIAQCGSLCRMVRKHKNGQVVVQAPNGFYVRLHESDVYALTEIDGIPLTRAA
jgi:hypothetical protein